MAEHEILNLNFFYLKNFLKIDFFFFVYLTSDTKKQNSINQDNLVSFYMIVIFLINPQ